MKKELFDFVDSVWSILPKETEFWSAIIGAVVGGGIALIGQLIAMRYERKKRAEDRLEVKRALAHSLLFKVLRIHTNFYGMYRHIEDHFERAERKGLQAQPWQIVAPLANPPKHLHFSSDEMGMLLSLKDDDVFNSLASLDVVHNSLVDLFNLMMQLRMALTDSLKASGVEGVTVSGVVSREDWQRLQPKMLEVNSLIDAMRNQAKRDFNESNRALPHLANLLMKKLDMKYRLELPTEEGKQG